MEAAETPVRCPVLAEPGSAAPHRVPLDPARLGPLLDPLLGRLADPAPVAAPLTFPLGTLQPDGRLDLCKQGLGPVGAHRVVPAALASPHAVHLLLGTNGLGSAGVTALAATLPATHRIRTLYLGCNHIDAAGVEPLAARLAEDRTVRALWLKRNPLGDSGVAALAAALRVNTGLRTLDLTNTGMTVRGLATLVAAVCDRDAPLERIYLGGNGFGPDAAALLARLLHPGRVVELYLAAGALGDDGARQLADALADALPADAPRAVLGLGGNGLGPPGVRALARRLSRLTALDLARPPSSLALRAVPNLVGDEGAAALADALPGSGLLRLDLRHTGVTGRGARRLLAAVVAGGPLQLLGLGSGVPRRIKREVTTRLDPPAAPPADIQAVQSVYR
jgi:Ran GTPase-activating protein (RanGAP) involved in mRNA processing and transport